MPLLAFSCSRRGSCPSCAAKRAALFGALLREETVEEVGHCLWTFTVPKLLRPLFLHRRRLLGKLCQAAKLVFRHKRARERRGEPFDPPSSSPAC